MHVWHGSQPSWAVNSGRGKEKRKKKRQSQETVNSWVSLDGVSMFSHMVRFHPDPCTCNLQIWDLRRWYNYTTILIRLNLQTPQQTYSKNGRAYKIRKPWMDGKLIRPTSAWLYALHYCIIRQLHLLFISGFLSFISNSSPSIFPPSASCQLSPSN